MIFVDQMKNLKIYHKPLYLPTIENDKKKRSAVMLLTPNYESSKRLMNHPLLINRLRFQSYYLEQDVSYYIKGKVSKNLISEKYVYNATHEDLYQNINEITTKERNRIDEEDFGLPKQRKYPLDTPAHVRSAVKFFNYASKEDEKELAKNLNKAIKKFNLKIQVGDANRFSKYYTNPVKESTVEEQSQIFDVNNIDYVSILFYHPKKGYMFVSTPGSNKYTIPGFPVKRETDIRVIKEEIAKLAKECFDIEGYTEKDIDHMNFMSEGMMINNTTYVYYINSEPIVNSPEKYDSILWDNVDHLLDDENINIDDLLYSWCNNWLIEHNDISNTIIDSLSSFIYFSGYSKDIEVIRKIITPSSYYNILKNLYTSIKDIKDIPILRINVCRNKTDTNPNVYTDCVDGYLNVTLDVPDYTIGDFKNYILDVYKSVYHAILYSKFDLKDTYLTKLIEDYLTENEAGWYKYAYWLFDKSGEISLKGVMTGLRTIDKLPDKIFHILIKQFKEFNPTSKGYFKNGDYVSTKVPDIEEDSNSEEVEESVCESYIFNETESVYHNEDYLRMGDIVTFFNEDGKYDTEIRRLLYNERMKQRTDLLAKYKVVKEENPWIKYTFPDLKRYQQKNLFVDLYYYNELFFKNNVWKMQKGYNLYLELLGRLINDPRISNAGYEKKTIFIPILDWNHNPGTRMWLYKEDINPISILFELMRTNSNLIKSIFKDINIIFFSNDKYFKLDFSAIEEFPKAAITLRRFINIIINKQEFDIEDTDTESEAKESPEAIKANIIDKIEDSKGVDITGKDVLAKQIQIDTSKAINKGVSKNKPLKYVDTSAENLKDTKTSSTIAAEEKQKEKNLTKQADLDAIKRQESDLEKLALSVDNVSNYAKTTDDAIDMLNSENIRDILMDISSETEDSVKVDPARSARMNQLDKTFLDSSIKGKTVKDILAEKPVEKQLETTKLKIASPNKEWQDMKYMNFDKDYNLEKDIIACFYHFTKVSKPIAIRKIDITDNSTSEDRLDLYSVEVEDYKGKRYTIKLDIPRMVDNRLLLRGNSKSIQTQLFNMPIIKTNLDTCQIVSNYQKIFIYRVNTVTGRSHPKVGKFLKAISKYTGKDIKISFGDNERICNKYEVSYDYIDISKVVDKIETDDVIIYFNQDEIRSLYPNIDDSMGVPFAYDKKDKLIKYFKLNTWTCIVDAILLLISNHDFYDLYDAAKPSTSGTYSRCNILSEKIPLVIVAGYMEGLTSVLNKAHIEYQIKDKLTNEERKNYSYDYIKFKDGYLYYHTSNDATMLLNGLKECSTDLYSIYDIDKKTMFLEFLDNYGGRIKADGLDNFYDCLIDPMTLESLQYYKLPTDVVSILLYANMLLCDNKFIKHTNMTSRRIRRGELIAAYAYEAISEGYSTYSNLVKHGRTNSTIAIKQSAVIDKILTSPISSDDSIINALYAVETTNAVTFKGKAGLNSDRSYSLDKRTYDDSMLNVLGMSTNFSANVGITRQATMDMNIEGERGYIKSIDSDTDKMNTAKSLCATEALTPFGSTRDDSQRTYMTFIQTAKHMLRTKDSDPLLITNGADEAMPYLTLDKFAFKAKDNGVIKELTDDLMIVEYDNGTKDYINLKETVEKNSDGGFYVPLKLDKMEGLEVGKKIKKQDVLAYDKLSFSNRLGESGNLAYNNGKLVKVAVINTDDGFEDSGICSESLSKKLAFDKIEKFDHVIDKDADVIKIKKIGDHVDVEEALVVWNDPHDDEDADTLMRLIGKDNEEEVSELGRKTLRSENSGTIVDIKIYRTVEVEDLSPSLQKIIKDYETPINQLKKKLKSQGIDTSELPATYKLDPTGKLKRAQQAILIEFYISYSDTIAVGDKIVYFSANKATIKNIIPSGKEPYTDFRPNEPIDAFVSETSISKRMVSSTIINGSINKLLIELDRTIKDKLGIKYDDSTV